MKLEARFHPPSAASRAYIVVGHLTAVQDDAGVRVHVEPAESLVHQIAPATLLATLRHLVAMTSPRSLDRLETLRTSFWSFIRIDTSTPSVHDV